MKKLNVIQHRVCHICQHKDLELLWSLPKLPLTGRYTQKLVKPKPQGIDQDVLFCGQCGHVQLAVQVDPVALYDDAYYFRTSTSQKARAGTDFFLSCLRHVVADQKFKSVIDVGCNDLYLLERLADRVQYRTGIDPLWAKKKSDRSDIEVIGSTVEGVDLKQGLKQQPDLIVCRHTLEHIAEPMTTLQKLMAAAEDQAVFCFEVPGFDGLLERYRFDQIFHEHLNYYSLPIFRRMIENIGGEYLAHFENRHDWGALCIMFRKTGKRIRTKFKIPYRLKDIQKRYKMFKDYMEICSHVMGQWPKEKYAYGAAQMLPVLAYHLKTDFSDFNAVLDDDRAKVGLQYWNLPLKIMSSQDVDLSQTRLVLTAVDNVQPILKKLLDQRPLDMVVPLMVY